MLRVWAQRAAWPGGGGGAWGSIRPWRGTGGSRAPGDRSWRGGGAPAYERGQARLGEGPARPGDRGSWAPSATARVPCRCWGGSPCLGASEPPGLQGLCWLLPCGSQGCEPEGLPREATEPPTPSCSGAKAWVSTRGGLDLGCLQPPAQCWHPAHSAAPTCAAVPACPHLQPVSTSAYQEETRVCRLGPRGCQARAWV